MNNAHRNLILALFISLTSAYVLAWHVYGVLGSPLQFDNHWIGDWLINYSGGFVRRGLFGQIALSISRVTHVDVVFLVVAVQCFLFLVFSKIVYDILKDKVDQATIAIILAPAFLTFTFSELTSSFRKELLHFLIFAFLCRRFAQGRPFSSTFLAAVTAAYAFAVFSHEAISFLFLYYVFLLYLAFRSTLLSIGRFAIFSSAISLLAAVSLILSAANSGGERIYQQICESLVDSGLDAGVCGGAISWLTRHASDGIALVKVNIATYHYLEVYSSVFVLSALPFVVFELLVGRGGPDQSGGGQWRLRRWAYVLFIAGTLLSIPLFVLSVDWGRWIYFQFASFSILFMAMYRGQTLPGLRDARGAIIKNRRLRTGLVACLCCANLFWGIPTSRRQSDTYLNDGVYGILKIRFQSMMIGNRG